MWQFVNFLELLSTLTNYQFAIVDCGRGLKPQGGAFRRERTHTFTYKSKFKEKYACANVFKYEIIIEATNPIYFLNLWSQD